MLVWQREQHALWCIDHGDACVALLVDTTLPPHHPTVVIECFGLKTIITVAHAWLQERTGRGQ